MKLSSAMLCVLLSTSAWAAEPKPTAPASAPVAAAPASPDDAPISDKERQQAAAKVIAELEQKYVFPDVARRHLPELKKRWRSAAFAKHATVRSLVKAMNADLADLFHDGHLFVSPPRPAFGGPDQTPAELDAFLSKMHYDIRRAEVLPGNVGYLRMDGFAPYEFEGARRAIADAMNFVSDTDALVLDLRHHRGGDLPTVALLVSYFTEGRIHLLDAYDRTTGKTEQSFTFEKVDGRRYGKQRDVYVLISKRTFSAGEEFAYDMQGLKRATLVGEPTGGGANNNMFIPVSEHLVVSMPFGTVKSAFTGTNWEGVGVKPEVAVEPHRALRVAHEAALTRLQERATSPGDKARLGRALEWLRNQPEEPAPASATRASP